VPAADRRGGLDVRADRGQRARAHRRHDPVWPRRLDHPRAPGGALLHRPGGAVMTRRTAETVGPFQGSDLRLDYALGGGFFEDADVRAVLGARGRDLARASGLDNLTQAIANRLKTRRGELAELGHPSYGSRH